MARARLFVKSKSVTVITGHVNMETMGAVYWNTEYAEGSTLQRFSNEDIRARDILRRSGIEFDLVDLSKGVKTSLVARIHGVKETPTLEIRESALKRCVGLKAISDYVNESRPQTEN